MALSVNIINQKKVAIITFKKLQDEVIYQVLCNIHHKKHALTTWVHHRIISYFYGCSKFVIHGIKNGICIIICRKNESISSSNITRVIGPFIEA